MTRRTRDLPEPRRGELNRNLGSQQLPRGDRCPATPAKRDQMSVAELQELEEVKGLVARGQQVGVLTYAEIETATAELGLDESDVEELHGLFERSEIELVEEIDPATAASLNIERAPEKRTRRRAALDLKPEGTTDALQLFLRDIGKVRLLTRPGGG